MPTALFQDWLSLFVALGATAKGIYDWAESAVNQSRERNEKQAIYMLRNAAVLVAALRALHNSIKTILGRVSLLDPDTPHEQRIALMQEINDFARRDFILGFIRQVERELRELLYKEENLDYSHRTKLERLLQYAGSTLRAAHDPYGSPFQTIEGLERFLHGIKEAHTVQEIETLKQAAAETIRAFDSRILVDADDAYSALRVDLFRRYPSLPDPSWTMALDALQQYTH
jgi:hypothetical protein